MSTPHDPWAAGPSEPGPPPGAPEPSAPPTDQTVIRDTDGTYVRPTQPGPGRPDPDAT